MIDAPELVQTESLPYAGLNVRCSAADMRKVMGPGIAEVVAALQEQGRAPTGPWFTHHLRRPTDTFDFEICFPLAEAIEPQDRVVPGIWPAMTLARTVFSGNYSGLPQAWPALNEWMKAQGHVGGTELWERYLVGPNDNPDPSAWRTELNWPLA